MMLKNITFTGTRISDQLKEILKEIALGLRVGDRIPSEDDIARQFKVSKVTVRAALGALEAEGLVERRRGVFGGNFVAKPSSDKMGEVVMNYYRMGDVTPEDLVEFRAILEPTLAGLAAERWTDKELETLKGTIDQFEKDLREGNLNSRAVALEFHYVLADMCHNALTSHVMRALSVVFAKVLDLFPWVMDDARIDLAYSKQLYECFLRRDGDGARRIMTSHFNTLKGIVERWRRTQAVKDENLEDKP
ncbi:MAG: Pyruvate dehydrogenase complex repressor [Syntrophorhabdus sp. PtaU1.Bin050]|nr:MAG: Pyruvate dehydrogenase complex repressor [Syntrophorhabdus sp. PtaU1.Bin050]